MDNTLQAEQKSVKGNIECIYLPNDPSIVLICNEEGKINGMKCNRDIGYDIIFSPFLIVGNNYKNRSFKSLTDSQILNYKIRFEKNSIIQTRNKVNSILLNRYNNQVNCNVSKSKNYEREDR